MSDELTSIYRTHRRALLALACSVTGCRQLAEDSIHEAFLRICRTTASPSGDLTRYVFAAVRNTATDFVRQRSRQPPPMSRLFRNVQADVAEQPSDRSINAADQLIQQEEQTLLQHAVESLGPDARETVILRIWGGLTFEAIGEVTAISPKTAETRFRRALLVLDQRLRGLR